MRRATVSVLPAPAQATSWRCLLQRLQRPLAGAWGDATISRSFVRSLSTDKPSVLLFDSWAVRLEPRSQPVPDALGQPAWYGACTRTMGLLILVDHRGSRWGTTSRVSRWSRRTTASRAAAATSARGSPSSSSQPRRPRGRCVGVEVVADSGRGQPFSFQLFFWRSMGRCETVRGQVR